MSTIAVEALTKQYGTVTAVDDLTFRLAPGRITGFLGPNGAGKSTTIRVLLGLARPTSGRATINGRPYAELRDPLRHVGALIDPNVFHPGRPGRTALRIAARPARIPGQRVEEVLDLTGLASAGHRRVGGYSLGMRQRLALAAALLGDPQILILDEPASGLDPEGVHWLRGLHAASPMRAAPSSCPATSSPSWHKPPTTWSSSTRAGSSQRARWPACSSAAKPPPSKISSSAPPP
jgi:ABC-2 type transport system ATP-binding protein